MIPLRDDQPRTTIPYVNYSIIAINLAVFGFEVWARFNDPPALRSFFARYAEVPNHFQLAFGGSSEFTIGAAFLTIFTSMFMHAGWLHVLGNMWFLWIFGDNIEDHLGHVVYPMFYLVCGLLASMAHVYANPDSTLPMVGASGAIAGVMGAFLLRYPQARIQVLWTWFGYRMFWMPAIGMLFYWFALQLVGQAWVQYVSSRTHQQVGGVAYWAHLGGFVTGLILIKVIPSRSEYNYGAWTKKEEKAVAASANQSSGSQPQL